MSIQIRGVLEVDNERGVIYFHASSPKIVKKYGSVTLLRICCLPTPIPQSTLDITWGEGASWKTPSTAVRRS